jgi:hypothetical protein
MREVEGQGEEDLRRMVGRLATRVRLLLAAQKEGADGYFRYRLLEETERSKRYNHYCSVLILQPAGTDPEELHRRVAPLTRLTDVVGLVQAVPNDGGAEGQDLGGEPRCPAVAAILPETGQDGCVALMERLRDSFLNMKDVSFGSAVFPDDSTDAWSLLEIAERRAA